jgi:tetratricopeptide (TPR) repeat protein
MLDAESTAPNHVAPKSDSGLKEAGPGTYQRRTVVVISILLFLFTTFTFLPSKQNGFVNFDDDNYFYGNVHVRNGLSSDSIRWAFTTFEKSMWHPVTWLSILLDDELFGLEPGMHHLTGLLIHAANAALLFLVFRRMTGAVWPSAFVAAMFGVHPLHVESVAWASERKDVLSTFFWMLTLLMYVIYVERSRNRMARSRLSNEAVDVDSPAPTQASSGESSALWFYLLALGFFILGLMSKAMLVTLPVVLLLLDWWPLKRFAFSPRVSQSKDAPIQPTSTIWHLLIEKLPFVAASIAISIVALIAQRSSGALQNITRFPLGQRIENAILSCGNYLYQTVWPVRLAVYYPYPKDFSPVAVGLVALLFVAFSIFVLQQAKRRPYLAMGWGWFLITLLPVIGLVQIGHQARADRYTYVPLIGIFAIVAWGANDLTRRLRDSAYILSAAAAAAIIPCIPVSRTQIGYWKDSETLYRHALAVTKDNELANNDLGTELFRKKQFDEALQHFREVVRITPDDPRAHRNLGTALFRLRRLDEAIPEFETAIRLKPDFAAAHSNLGTALGMKGRIDEAIVHLQAAARYAPNDVEAHSNLGVALAHKGHYDEAIVELQEALRLKPDYTEAQNNLRAAINARNAASNPAGAPAKP